jgi:hypothetical protein
VDWVKLGVRYFFDPKVRGMNGDLADAAEVMFVRSCAWGGEEGRAGFIPEQDVELLTRRRRHADVVRMLISLGLWVAVPGGYRVVRWPDWNGELDVLTQRRATDRDRQRRRRERLREPVDPLSRDASRDVTPLEGEGDKDKEGGNSRRVTHAARARDQPPPPRQCPKHVNDTDPPPCGPCKTARLNHERWQTDQTAARAERQRTGRRCPTHPTEPADHCRPCRSERLARTETP